MCFFKAFFQPFQMVLVVLRFFVFWAKKAPFSSFLEHLKYIFKFFGVLFIGRPLIFLHLQMVQKTRKNYTVSGNVYILGDLFLF